MNTPTTEAVAHAAYVLMEASPRGETTTLEVKTLLRHLNFQVKQDFISIAMTELEEGMNWSVKHVNEEGKQFKVFSKIPSIGMPLFKFR